MYSFPEVKKSLDQVELGAPKMYGQALSKCLFVFILLPIENTTEYNCERLLSSKVTIVTLMGNTEALGNF